MIVCCRTSRESPIDIRLNLTREQALRLGEQGNVIPLVGEIPGDLLTPVGAFLRLATDRSHAFLLESVEGGDRLGRYSFLGCDPWKALEIDRLAVRAGNPLESIRELMQGFQQAPVPDLPPFTGGAVGSLAYDAVRALETLPDLARDDLAAPDLMVAFYDAVVAFDHVRQRIQIIANLLPGHDGSGPDEAYRRAEERIEEIALRLTAPLRPPTAPALPPGVGNREPGPSHRADPLGVRSVDRSSLGGAHVLSANLSKSEFLERVRTAQQEIARGEIFQVVLSRRLTRPFTGDAFAVYRALRAINPSPYNFYLRHGERALAGASPEMLVRVRGGLVETRPIAGTRPRGSDDGEDERLAAELMRDPKERAEHLMLVDLGRNDVGRVSAPGSVSVRRFAEIERFSHVMHLVSSVEGVLRQDRDSFDALLACFPAGTVSGAPKVRAMEIIESLEPTRRGPYAGAVFYRGFDGALDSAIAIRTVFLSRGTAYVQAGAGIVADSDPEREFYETEGKARAATEALEHAEPLP